MFVSLRRLLTSSSCAVLLAFSMTVAGLWYAAPAWAGSPCGNYCSGADGNTSYNVNSVALADYIGEIGTAL